MQALFCKIFSEVGENHKKAPGDGSEKNRVTLGWKTWLRPDPATLCYARLTEGIGRRFNEVLAA
jgi:hypothetical protein